ncbi:ubiquitin family domain-containing protein [Ditylenchus destructor]|uniref:Ubiquitin family domain-containing protein n=1 Tax=Ditylenchus destructor TaxID=166010 RepID=A0AAD4QW49_9BILA|nr:ubiquitin family domain-containing protein [Ditylenchus destructor]
MDRKEDTREELIVVMYYKQKYITVVVLTGKEYKFPLLPPVTVRDLRKSMGEHLGIPAEQLTLTFVGKLLEDADGKLPSGIQDGSTVKLGLKQTTGFTVVQGKMYS